MFRYLRRLDPRRWILVRQLRRIAKDQGGTERLNQFLAVQHYIRDEKEQFREALDKLRSRKFDGQDVFAKAKFLPAILEANICFYEGDFADAVAGYREAIAKTTSEYQRTLFMRFRLRERRKLDFLSMVLALLHNNLAAALARVDPDTPEVLEAFANAIELQPGLVMLREGLGDHYAGRHLWKQAEAAYRDAYASAPTGENEVRLQGSLANLRRLHAETLCNEEKLDEAIDVLEASIRELSETELDAWMGKTQFEIGGVRRRQGRTADAAAAYERSADLYMKASDRASSSYVTEVLAELWALDGKDELALQLLEKSQEISLDPKGNSKKDRPRDARLKSKMAILLLLLGRPTDAERLLDESRELWRDEGWFEPLGKIVSETGELLKRDEALIRLKIHLERRLRRASKPSEARDLIEALRRCQRGVLNYILPPNHPTANQMSTSMIPVVTPLAVEIDEAYLNDAGGEDRVVEELAPAMRKRLEDRYGVKVPGLRLRGNEGDLPYGTYVLIIHEVPLRSGNVGKNHRLYLGDRARLDAAGIISGSDQSRSWQGEPAFWIEERYWEKASAAGLELLEALEFPFRDFENLIAANLVEFVGHQEVQNLLETSKLVGPGSDDIVAKETHTHMGPLTNVVRALVSERVPITDFPHVYSLFRTLWSQRMQPWRITEAIRTDAAIRPRLWGNHADFSHFKLGDSLMATIDGGVRGLDGTVLALEPELTQQVLTAVRTAVEGFERPAIIVPRQSRRSVTRRLLEVEFPQLPVLAMAELEPGLGGRIIGTVELESEPVEGTP